MKKIELYGLPCSGKTFISNILKEKINQDNKSLHTYQSAFFEYVFYEKKINFIEFLSLKYFKYFKNKKDTDFLKNIKKKSVYKKKLTYRNPLSNYLYMKYLNLCNRYAKKKNNILKNIIFKEIDNNHHLINNVKRNAKLWFIEFFAYEYIAEKNKNKIDFLVDDEALFQKIFVFFNVLNNDDFLKKYINLLHKPTYLIEVESSNSNIILRSKKRVGSSKFHYQNFKHLSNMIKYKNKIKKIISKKNKLITLKNNYNYFKQIDKFYETIK